MPKLPLLGHARENFLLCSKMGKGDGISRNRRQSGFVVLLLVFGLFKIASAEARSPVPEQLQYLEEPNRGEWQMPERIIDTLKLRKSDVVADVGGIFRVDLRR